MNLGAQIGVASLARLLRQQAREKAEKERLPIQMLEELRGLRVELQEERRERERLAAQVQAHELEIQQYRSGARGRPGSRHLVVDEFQRRASAGRTEKTLADQALVLAEWLRKAHPIAHPMTAKSIENVLRIAYREWKRSESSKRPRRRR